MSYPKETSSSSELAAVSRRRVALAEMLAREASTPSPAGDAAPPQPSRAAQAAEIHLAGVNASRKRCGLAPFSEAELAHEFAELDQLPPARARVTRRDAGNLAAQRLGAPSSSQEIKSMWDGIVARLNASLPARGAPAADRRDAAARDDGRPQHAAVDWGEISNKLNREAGLATPDRGRTR
jgi:hypothetical protein